MDLAEYLSTLSEEMLPQTARNLFLNNMIDPDYENIRTIIKSTKRKAVLTEYLQDMREREDGLERHSRESRKQDKFQRAFDFKKCPDKNTRFSEEPQPKRQRNDWIKLPRFIGSEIKGNQKDYVCAWLCLENKLNMPCTEQKSDEDHKR